MKGETNQQLICFLFFQESSKKERKSRRSIHLFFVSNLHKRERERERMRIAVRREETRFFFRRKRERLNEAKNWNWLGVRAGGPILRICTQGEWWNKSCFSARSLCLHAYKRRLAKRKNAHRTKYFFPPCQQFQENSKRKKKLSRNSSWG